MYYLCRVIQEEIQRRMRETRRSQRSVSIDTGIEYSALNTFLNNRKGMWFGRVQSVLTCVGLYAVGSVQKEEPMTIQQAALLEIRHRRLNIGSIAKDIDVSYSLLQSFLHDNRGMKLDKVESLMSILGIKLVPK